MNMHKISMKWFAIFALLLWAAGAKAACSGSGVTWTCTAGTTPAQISAALSSAANGATLTFAAGSYTWNSSTSFDNAKGATLICASVGACNVAANGMTLGLNGNLSGTNTNLYRISGFRFTGGNFLIWFWGPGTSVMTRVRIDNNTFTGQPADARIIAFGENSNINKIYGVVDHNTVTNSSQVMLAEFYLKAGSFSTGTVGTGNNMFFENNSISFTSMGNPGLGCVDVQGGASVVWRFNSTTNCLVTSHGVNHGGGTVSFELYNNFLAVNAASVSQGFQDGYRLFHHQGSGEFIAFNNTFTAYNGKSSDALDMMYYRSDPALAAGYGTCNGSNSIDGNRPGQSGYPCWHQPGRDDKGALKPIYVWGNKWSDTQGKVDLGGKIPTVHLVENRDYYNAVSAAAQTSPTSPFNGTTGMGHGTLANRPMTCATNLSEPGGGVGYFAVDQGAQGVLYRCSAANTWSVHYAPYTYPHPLVSGGGGGTVALVPPVNLTVQ